MVESSFIKYLKFKYKNLKVCKYKNFKGCNFDVYKKFLLIFFFIFISSLNFCKKLQGMGNTLKSNVFELIEKRKYSEINDFIDRKDIDFNDIMNDKKQTILLSLFYSGNIISRFFRLNDYVNDKEDEKINFLICKLVKKLKKENINSSDENKKTSLYKACTKGDVLMVRFLIENGAIDSVNKKDCFGWTPLMWACESGDRFIFLLLLEHGAAESINWVNDCDKTCLYLACVEGSEEIVKKLLENGANIDQKSRDFIFCTNIVNNFIFITNEKIGRLFILVDEFDKKKEKKNFLDDKLCNNFSILGKIKERGFFNSGDYEFLANRWLCFLKRKTTLFVGLEKEKNVYNKVLKNKNFLDCKISLQD